MNIYHVVIYQNDQVIHESKEIYEGDSFVFDPPDAFFFGRGAVLKWRLRRANKQIEFLHKLLDKERAEVDLTFIETDKLTDELHRRAVEMAWAPK